VIDDLEGIDAAYEFAGIVGVDPRGLTLRQLWRMASGIARQRRIETMHLICVAFNDSLDIRRFLQTGQIEESSVGKPLKLSDELEEQVQAEIERIRRENPNLPKLHATGGE
jgi:hypothetical protein